MAELTQIQQYRCELFWHFSDDIKLLIKTKKLLAEEISTRISPLTQSEDWVINFKIWNKQLTKRNAVLFSVIIRNADDLFNLSMYDWVDKAAGIEQRKQRMDIVALARLRVIRIIYEAFIIAGKDLESWKQRMDGWREFEIEVYSDNINKIKTYLR